MSQYESGREAKLQITEFTTVWFTSRVRIVKLKITTRGLETSQGGQHDLCPEYSTRSLWTPTQKPWILLSWKIGHVEHRSYKYRTKSSTCYSWKFESKVLSTWCYMCVQIRRHKSMKTCKSEPKKNQCTGCRDANVLNLVNNLGVVEACGWNSIFLYLRKELAHLQSRVKIWKMWNIPKN